MINTGGALLSNYSIQNDVFFSSTKIKCSFSSQVWCKMCCLEHQWERPEISTAVAKLSLTPAIYHVVGYWLLHRTRLLNPRFVLSHYLSPNALHYSGFGQPENERWRRKKIRLFLSFPSICGSWLQTESFINK